MPYVSPDPELVVASARAYLGTKYHHQGRLIRVGVDCIGILVGVGRTCGAEIEDCTNYSNQPDGKTLIEQCEKNLKREDGVVPGRIGIFAFDSGMPQHAAIFTPYGMIHTYTRVRKVVEHVYDEYWQKRLHSVWSYKCPL